MKKTTLAVLVTVAFSVVGVLGDYFLKLASAREQPLRTGWFYLGFGGSVNRCVKRIQAAFLVGCILMGTAVPSLNCFPS